MMKHLLRVNHAVYDEGKTGQPTYKRQEEGASPSSHYLLMLRLHEIIVTFRYEACPIAQVLWYNSQYTFKSRILWQR